MTDASEVYHEVDAEKAEHASVGKCVIRGKRQERIREIKMRLSTGERKNRKNKNWDSWAEETCGIKKTDRLIPIFALCVYHGQEKWDGPRHLRDMMDFGKDEGGISSLFHDYPMRLCCLNEMEDFHVFHTEIKQVFQILQCRQDKKQLRELLDSDAAYRHVDEDTLEVI